MEETTAPLHEADARGRASIGDGDADAFRRDGFLVVRNAIIAQELLALRCAADALLDEAQAIGTLDPDFAFAPGGQSGRPVLRRVEYVVSRKEAMRRLLGHPFILRSVQKVQGAAFLPTFDSMVVKMPGEGIEVPWHRDCELPPGSRDLPAIFNVDFYLDDAGRDTCLWVIPGSNHWSEADAARRCAEPGFRTDDAVPVPMRAGDVIFHDVTVLHGSPAGHGNALRRTVYYEFRPCEAELRFGPHTPAFIPLKQQVLLHCLAMRAGSPMAAGEDPYVYSPGPGFDLGDARMISRLRFPHTEYWR